jgi:hypothetical protein
MPIIAQVLAVQTIANAGWAKAPNIGVAHGWASCLARDAILKPPTWAVRLARRRAS